MTQTPKLPNSQTPKLPNSQTPKLQEICAIIIVRSGSVRVKNKALLQFGSKNDNLLTHKIKQLKNCKFIDRVIVGSDSNKVLNFAEQAGAQPIKRDEYFCDEAKCSINEAIFDMCSKIATDVVVWAHCTNPLLSAATFDKAITTYVDNLDQGFDSLVSVVELREHLWNEHKKPFNYNPYQEKHPLASSLPALYMQDGGIFIQSHSNMLSNSYFFGKKPYLFCIPKQEFLDINEYRDYVIAKALYQHQQAN